MKSPTQDSLDQLKRQGHRMTRIRAAIVHLLQPREEPISVAELISALKLSGLRPNKTTIYRELSFLMEAGLVAEVDLGDGRKRYESGLSGHHHHLVCLNCGAIQELQMNSHLSDQEKRIEQEHDFQVLRHRLEFYGLCSRCQA